MPLRAGIVGCGGISRSHATAYAHLGAASLVAVCDVDPARLQTRADEFEVPGRYADYREMFARERLDVVSVCTHAPLHAAAQASTCCAKSRWRSTWRAPTAWWRTAPPPACNSP